MFGIEQKSLRAILKGDYGNKYYLMLGRTINVKRKQFEKL